MIPKLSRRELLKVMAVGVTGVIGVAGIKNYGKMLELNRESPTIANRLLDDFPEEIPGAREIRKYKTSGANKTLVHIRQQHIVYPYSSLEDLLSLEEEGLELIKEIANNYIRAHQNTALVQRDIYAILSHLIDYRNLREVYSEGVTPQCENLVNNSPLDIITSKLAKLFSSGYFGEKWENRPKDFFYVSGADLILAHQKGLKIRAAEDSEINSLTYKVIELSLERELEEIGHDIREDVALKLISQSSRPLDVIIYGGWHDFSDNISKWNSQKPNKRYSLIEITPENY